MKSAIYLAVLLTISSSVADAQFLKYPRPVRDTIRRVLVDSVIRTVSVLDDSGRVVRVDTFAIGAAPSRVTISSLKSEGSGAQLLPEGRIGTRGGTPAVGATLVALYIAPDIESWNWRIPVVLNSSSIIEGGAQNLKQVAADILDNLAGALRLSATGHWERRGVRRDGEPSITGLYVDGGFVTKVSPLDTPDNQSSRYLATIAPHAQAEFRITTKTRPADDYSGVLHLRASISGNAIVRGREDLQRLFGTDNLKRITAVEFTIGWFPFDGASINLITLSSAVGNLPQEFKNRFSTGISLFPR